MKKTTTLIASIGILFSQEFQAQNVIPNNGTGQNPNAYVGIGIGTGNLPTQNLQVHGAINYIRERPGLVFGNENPTPGGGNSPIFTDFGVTSAISLTNTITGKGDYHGAIIRMSLKNFTIDNLEQGGDILLAASGANMLFQGATKRVYTGGTLFSIDNMSAGFNVFANETVQNGINIKTSAAGNNGLSIQMAANSDNAIRVYSAGLNGKKNFAVTSAGEVYARKYTTTLNNIPDYVFEKDYKLLSFSALKAYIEQNKHLPNIPSATEYKEIGVDLGELNRLLLEKTEEQTLYILQLEERMKTLEAQMLLLLQPKGDK